MVKQKQILDIIKNCYDAVLNPELWPHNLDQITKLCHVRSSTLVYDDSINDHIYVALSEGMNLDAVADYNNYYNTIDLITRAAFETPGIHLIQSMEVIKSNPSLLSTEFEDFAKSADICNRAGFSFNLEGGKHCVFAVQLGKDKPFEQQQIQMLKYIKPHIIQAIQLYSQFTHLVSVKEALSAKLERLNFGVILLSQTGCVIHLNKLAEKLLKKYPALSISKRILYTQSASHTKRLHNIIRNAVDSGSGQTISTGSGYMKLRTPDSPHTLDIAVTPFKSEVSSILPFGEYVCAAVFIANPVGCKPPLTKVLKQIYGITTAEAEVLKHIANGLSPKETAEIRHASIHTVRHQLKSIMSKTGVKRQAELVKLVHSGFAALLSE